MQISVSPYYVYVYYDPRNGEPIYVGMGKGERAFKHWKKKVNNRFFQNVLNRIRQEGLSPRIEFAALDLNFEEAVVLEMQLIQLHGRRDLGLGPLTNLTSGGCGAKELNYSDDLRKIRSEDAAVYWTTADRKEHGKKISQVFSLRTQEELEVVKLNIKKSRTPEVRAAIGTGTKERMQQGDLREKVLASLQTPKAQAKRKDSLQKFSNTDVGRENRRRAANIRWERVRAEKTLLSDSCPESE